MRSYTPEEREGKPTGKFFLIYGEFGVGKTMSCLATLPEPIAYIVTEPRDPLISIETVKDYYKKDVKVRVFGPPNSIEELKEWFHEAIRDVEKDDFPYPSVVLDSASFYQSELLSDIMKDTWDSEIFTRRKLVDQKRTDEAGYGAMAEFMKEITKMAGRLSQSGVVVIFTAALDDKPKWNRELSAAPSWLGRAFPKVIGGMIDFIGKVENNYEKGNIIYPPWVSFRSEDGSFQAKCVGKLIIENATEGPLDFEKILGILE